MSMQEQKSRQMGYLLEGLRRESGVEVPFIPQREYTSIFGTLNTPITPAEAEVITTTVRKIPGASTLVSLIVPYRQPLDKDHLKYHVNGLYLGHFWGPFIQGENNDYSEEKLTINELLSNKSAVALDLPNIGMEEAMTSEHLAVSSILPSFFIGKGYGEQVAYIIAHEFGHGLVDHIWIEAFADKEEYARHRGANSIPSSLKGFASLVGWRLINMLNFERYGNGETTEHTIHNYSHSLHTEWRKLKGRKNIELFGERLTSIEEAFANYWALSILYPELLSAGEQSYFNIFHQGLTAHPEEFIRAIAHGEIVISYQ